MKRNLSWDGEKIVQELKYEPQKFSTKDVLNTLDEIEASFASLDESEKKLKESMSVLESDRREQESMKKELLPFEEKCIEIQLNKLKNRITQISADCKAEAIKKAKELVDKNPDSYTEDQIINQQYVLYQRFLATDKKVAEEIAPRIYKKYLFEEPIFDNPFK